MGSNVCTGVLESGSTSKDSMYLATTCNATSYCIFVIGMCIMSCRNLSVASQKCTRVLEKGVTSRGSMYFAS